MEADLQLNEQHENRRRGMIGTIMIHALLILILLLPFITFPIPPPGQQGILVSLGIPDHGEGDDRPETQNKEEVKPTPAAAQPEKQPEPEPEVVKATAPSKPAEREVLTADEIAAINLKKQKENEARIKHEAELEKQREEAEARRKAEAEAKRKAEEEAKKQAEYDEAKKQFGNLLSGSGKGETGTPGNQGSPQGDPDASKLDGISTGSGRVGGGLGNRGVVYEPNINDNSQKVGRVVVNVCVDAKGEVISATYTQRGSTTTDSDLKALAIKSAKRFRFNESQTDKQCGTITIDFKVQ